MNSTTEMCNQVTAVILAGGAGRRMQGQDKGLLSLHGKPLIEHILERLRPQVGTILINNERNQAEYAKYGYPVIADTLTGGLGPLAGLLSGLENSQSDFVLSVPCDTPYLPTDLVARMVETLRTSSASACTVSDGERLHPVIMLVRREVVPSLKAYLNDGKRKVHDWFYSVPYACSDFSDQASAFININTPDELEKAPEYDEIPTQL